MEGRDQILDAQSSASSLLSRHLDDVAAAVVGQDLSSLSLSEKSSSSLSSRKVVMSSSSALQEQKSLSSQGRVESFERSESKAESMKMEERSSSSTALSSSSSQKMTASSSSSMMKKSSSIEQRSFSQDLQDRDILAAVEAGGGGLGGQDFSAKSLMKEAQDIIEGMAGQAAAAIDSKSVRRLLKETSLAERGDGGAGSDEEGEDALSSTSVRQSTSIAKKIVKQTSKTTTTIVGGFSE